MINIVIGQSELSEWISNQQKSSLSIDMATVQSVSDIKTTIETKGDQGLCELTKQFDHIELSPNELRIVESDIDNAYNQIDNNLVTALKNAAKNIHDYHLNQVPKHWEKASEDITYGVQFTAIDSVGLYVPGGLAAYPSSVLMTGIPANIAGCKRMVIVSPASDGSIPASVLVAADIVGIKEIYQIGGAQAIFALAFGTETIQAVDKIVGPGNRFVTAAKQMVYGTVDIDKPAGPSEVCIYIDNNTYSTYAASELLAQLEHDPDASAIAITSSKEIANAIVSHVKNQISALSRQNILKQSIRNAIIVVDDNPIDVCNTVASEHLVLLSDNANQIRQNIRHAGSIFCGPYTPVALGDYYAGPNHVLPTQGAARFSSPLGVMDFMKYSSYLSYSKTALQQAAHDMDILTTAEGFDAHNETIKIRINHGKA